MLGNRVTVGRVNANHEYSEAGVKALSLEYSDRVSRLLTYPIKGSENFSVLFEKLNNENDMIEIFHEVPYNLKNIDNL